MTQRRLVALALLVASGSACEGTARARSAASPVDPRAVAGVGSSSMYGFGATVAPFLTVLVDALGPGWWARNEGAPGEQSEECLGRWRTTVRGRGFGSLVLLCGANDVRAGRRADEAWARLRTILDEALADGMRAVPMTLQPFKGDRAWTPEKQRQLLALNASILSYCRSRSLACVDTYAALNDPAEDGAQQRRYDDGDHLHFNQAAHDLLGRLLREAWK